MNDMQTFKNEWQTLQVWGEQNIFITSSRSNNSLRKFGVTLMVDWNILTQLKESIVSDYCFNFVFNMLERLKLSGFCIVCGLWFWICYKIHPEICVNIWLDLRNWHLCRNYKLVWSLSRLLRLRRETHHRCPVTFES